MSGDNVGLGLLLGGFGSFSMATYMVPIKHPRVVEAQVHPLIFQCYKSFVVFATCWLFVIFNLIRDKPAFVFNIWGMLSAAAWIPSGLCTIAAVQKIGVGMTAVLSTGFSALVQFGVGQLPMIDQKFKEYGSGDDTYVLYPYYLLAMMVGMAGLILAPMLKFGSRTAAEKEPLQSGDQSSIPMKQLAAGLLLAVGAGIFSGMQFGVKSIGKSSTEPDCLDCAARNHWENQFDGFGSFQVNFGLGTALFTPIYLGLASIPEKLQGKPVPSFHFDVLKIYGTLAGFCWVTGFVFQNRGTSVGGIGVVGPSNQAMQLIAAGLWSLIYYREVREPKRIVAWIFFAIWTTVAVIFYGREKA